MNSQIQILHMSTSRCLTMNAAQLLVVLVVKMTAMKLAACTARRQIPTHMSAITETEFDVL